MKFIVNDAKKILGSNIYLDRKDKRIEHPIIRTYLQNLFRDSSGHLKDQSIDKFNFCLYPQLPICPNSSVYPSYLGLSKLPRATKHIFTYAEHTSGQSVLILCQDECCSHPWHLFPYHSHPVRNMGGDICQS